MLARSLTRCACAVPVERRSSTKAKANALNTEDTEVHRGKASALSAKDANEVEEDCGPGVPSRKPREDVILASPEIRGCSSDFLCVTLCPLCATRFAVDEVRIRKATQSGTAATASP